MRLGLIGLLRNKSREYDEDRIMDAHDLRNTENPEKYHWCGFCDWLHLIKDSLKCRDLYNKQSIRGYKARQAYYNRSENEIAKSDRAYLKRMYKAAAKREKKRELPCTRCGDADSLVNHSGLCSSCHHLLYLREIRGAS